MKQQIETPERRVLVPTFGVSRLRMATDGDGVTTLVTFVGSFLKFQSFIFDRYIFAAGY